MLSEDAAQLISLYFCPRAWTFLNHLHIMLSPIQSANSVMDCQSREFATFRPCCNNKSKNIMWGVRPRTS
nr:MAG TPA: hypothetical protein [Caudoviricetes sp.]